MAGDEIPRRGREGRELAAADGLFGDCGWDLNAWLFGETKKLMRHQQIFFPGL